jgi:hypothetical protein
MELGDVKSAKRDLHSAFQYRLKALNQGILLVTKMEYAELFNRMRKYNTAVEFCSLVNDHFARRHETRTHAATLLDSLRRQMSAAKYAQYRKKGCALNLWTCVKSSINELGAKTATHFPSKQGSKKTTARNLVRLKR